jgi:hypothetical protein
MMGVILIAAIIENISFIIRLINMLHPIKEISFDITKPGKKLALVALDDRLLESRSRRVNVVIENGFLAVKGTLHHSTYGTIELDQLLYKRNLSDKRAIYNYNYELYTYKYDKQILIDGVYFNLYNVTERSKYDYDPEEISTIEEFEIELDESDCLLKFKNYFMSVIQENNRVIMNKHTTDKYEITQRASKSLMQATTNEKSNTKDGKWRLDVYNNDVNLAYLKWADLIEIICNECPRQAQVEITDSESDESESGEELDNEIDSSPETESEESEEESEEDSEESDDDDDGDEGNSTYESSPITSTEPQTQPSIHYSPSDNITPVTTPNPEVIEEGVKNYTFGGQFGCIPGKGIATRVHAYFARYWNSLTHTKIKEDILRGYAKEFSIALRNKFGGYATPYYSKKCLDKYKDYFDNEKLRTHKTDHVHGMFCKAEFYGKANRPRVISNCNKPLVIKMLRYVYPIHDKLREFWKSYAPGKDKKNLNLNVFPSHLGGDYSGLDGSTNVQLRACVEEEIFKAFYQDPSEILDLLKYEYKGVYRIGKDRNGKNIYCPSGGVRLSGSALTSLMNTMIVAFLQFLFYRLVYKYTIDKALNAVGFCYGDDTTQHAKDIPKFKKFVYDSFGMKVDVEKSQKDSGYMFLSEYKTINGSQYDLRRVWKRSRIAFSGYSVDLAYAYKLMGAYVPKVEIRRKNKFKQLPVFAHMGKVAYFYIQRLAKFGQGTKRDVNYYYKQCFKSGFEYDRYTETMAFQDYTDQVENVLELDDLAKKLADTTMDILKRSGTKNILRKNFLNFLLHYEMLISDTWIFSKALLTSKKTNLVIDGNPFSDVTIEIDTSRVESVKHYLDFISKKYSKSESNTLLKTYIRFWTWLSKNNELRSTSVVAAATEITKLLNRLKTNNSKLNEQKQQSKTTQKRKQWKRRQKFKKKL